MIHFKDNILNSTAWRDNHFCLNILDPPKHLSTKLELNFYIPNIISVHICNQIEEVSCACCSVLQTILSKSNVKHGKENGKDFNTWIMYWALNICLTYSCYLKSFLLLYACVSYHLSLLVPFLQYFGV